MAGIGVPWLSARRLVPEKMDSDDLAPALHRGALAGIRNINRASRAAQTLWRPIRALCRSDPTRTWTLLDIATGGGDVPVFIAQEARKLGLSLRITGIDRSPIAVDHARAASREAGVGVRFQQCDAVAEETSRLPGEFDIVTCSLFLHQLDRPSAVGVLRSMRRMAGRLILVSDLRRSAAGWLAAWLGCRLLTRSPIVHYDGPVSVAAAWTPAELRAMATEAGLDPVTIVRRKPWRMLLSCETLAGTRA